MKFWLAVGMALGVLTARAASPVPYEFAIPEFTKTVSIGVYDDSGKLIRRLVQQAGIRDFEIGLNGLIGKWDGRNDAGEIVAAGVYHLRGFAVGDLSTEGTAYHFNDWIAELGDDAPIIRVNGIAASPHGGLYLLGETADARDLVFYYRPGFGLVWKRELTHLPVAEFPALPWFHPIAFQPDEWRESLIAADESTVAVVDRGTVTFFSALTGREIRSSGLAGTPHALTFHRGTLFVAEDRRLLAITPESGKISPPPESGKEWRALSAAGNHWIAADWAGAAWRTSGENWTPVKLEGEARMESLAMAGENSFWGVAVGVAGERLVGEFSLGGEFLKNLQAGDSRLPPVQVSAVSGGDSVYIRAGSAGRQQILGVRRPASGALPGSWEIILEKNIHRSASFGLKDGGVVAEVASVPDAHFTLQIRDFMTQQRKKVRLEMRADPTGVRLISDEGLVLDSLVESPNVSRVALESGKAPGTLRLFVGKPGLVEEFLVSGLSQVALLDVGEVEWRNE